MELLQQFEQEFAKLKQELKFKATFEELEEVFFLRDYICEQKYVSTNLSRQITARMTALFNNWYGYLHGIIVPNPGSMLNINESHAFDEEEKAEVMNMMNNFIRLSALNGYNGLTKDRKAEAQFIDEALAVWNKFKPTTVKISKKVYELWDSKSKTMPKPKKPESHYG